MEAEIEITPAMLVAGEEALAGFDPNEDRRADYVEAIYRAMERARSS